MPPQSDHSLKWRRPLENSPPFANSNHPSDPIRALEALLRIGVFSSKIDSTATSAQRPQYTGTRGAHGNEKDLEDGFIAHSNLSLRPPKPDLEIQVPPRLARGGSSMEKGVREPSIATAAARYLENKVLKPFDDVMAPREAELGWASRIWARGSHHTPAQERTRTKERTALSVLQDPRGGSQGHAPWQKCMADYILAGSGVS